MQEIWCDLDVKWQKLLYAHILLLEKHNFVATYHNINALVKAPRSRLEWRKKYMILQVYKKLFKKEAKVPDKKQDIAEICEKIPKLQYLFLAECELIEILPLKYITEAKEICLFGNYIRDFGALKHCPNIDFINLHSNNCEDLGRSYLLEHEYLDISSLKEVRAKKIYLMHNRIEDISPLKDMHTLEELYIARNRVKSLQCLENLTKLKKLNLYSNSLEQVADFEVLKKLKNLKSLDIGYQAIATGDKYAEVLKDCTQLEELSISWVGDDNFDIRFLANLTNLKKLDISDNKIKDISVIASLVHLEELNLDKTAVSNLDALQNLQNLHTLSLRNVYLNDIKGILSLKNLTTCHLPDKLTHLPKDDLRRLLELLPEDWHLNNLKTKKFI